MTTFILPNWFPVLGLIVAVFALILAVKNYRRKSGLLLRGNFFLSSGYECNDHYISSVLLENLKDRSVTILGIYLRIEHNYYIQLEDFGEKPLILKAYESYQKEFGSIQFYYSNGNRIDLNSLLIHAHFKKRLVLSTSDGKYLVPKPIPAWSPVYDYFKNGLTSVVHPITYMHEAMYVGENVRYIVEIKKQNKVIETILLTPSSYKFKFAEKLHLSGEALQSETHLHQALLDAISSGSLAADSFSIIDMSNWQGTAMENVGPTINGKYLDWIDYHIGGRVSTFLSRHVLKYYKSPSF